VTGRSFGHFAIIAHARSPNSLLVEHILGERTDVCRRIV
jgi:hypothetical protein